MRRRHPPEFGDQGWLPGSLRAALLDAVAFGYRLPGVLDAVLRTLRLALDAAGERKVVDVCSGSGGPWKVLGPEHGIAVTLTDRFPCLRAAERVPHRYDLQPIDARRLPEELVGARTIFGALHHFRPAEAVELLAALSRRGEPVLVFELTDRRPGALALNLFGGLLLPFVCSWRVGPAAAFWTYVIPVLPLVLAWDGVASCLRSYTVPELESLAAEASETTEWSAGTLPVCFGLTRVTWLLGVAPAEKDRDAA